MTDSKSPKQTTKVGDVVDAKQVTRPDGSTVTVTGGSYVLDATGTFVVDGAEVTVK